MQEGILTAADAVKRETGVDKINVVGYCVGGTLLATTLAYLAARGEEPVRLGELPRDAGRLHQCRRPAAVHRRRPARGAQRVDVRARLSRRLAHGQRVQHAAPARPHLAVHRQQLPARQEAVPVRPAVLEPGFDAHGGGQPQLLSARILQRQLPRQGQADDRRHAPRHAQGEDPRLRAGDERGSHRAGALGLMPARSCSAARSSSCCRARATSPASSIRPTR